jgi:hypothetical protein
MLAQFGALLSLLWNKWQKLHRRFISYVTTRPIVIILLAAPYLVATILGAIICNGAGKAAALIAWATIVNHTTHPYLDYRFAKILFFLCASLAWFHYLLLAFWCFRAAIRLRMTALSVVQLVSVTVFIFAAAHYYVALFSDGPSYANIHEPKPQQGWGYSGDFDDRLFFLPSVDTAVDFVYFSVATTATVGYGDIYPRSIAAKLVTIIQIGTSFTLVVVVLGWVVGRASALSGSLPAKKE